MSDTCPNCGSTDVAELYYDAKHEFVKSDKAQTCLDCKFKWGKP